MNPEIGLILGINVNVASLLTVKIVVPFTEAVIISCGVPAVSFTVIT